MKRTRIVSLTMMFLVIAFLVAGVYAQTDPSDDPSPVVTDDEVNAIAKHLFCPVCENIPLDTCATAACADWRDEIRLQLESGSTEQQIIDDFVYRFGDRVVGTPKSTIPRLVSLVTPWVAIAAGLYFGLQFLVGRQRQTMPLESSDGKTSDSTYRDLLEQDVAG